MSFIHEVLTYGNEIVQHVLDAVNGCVGNSQQAMILIFGGYTNNRLNKEMTERFFVENPTINNIPPVQSVIEFIWQDNFKDETYPTEGSNLQPWVKLQSLKIEMEKFYTQNVCESNQGAKFHEFHTKFYNMCLQLKRLRLVLQPEFHVIKNVHPVSKIPYLSVRGFWLDENDKKVKVFTKSLGREDSFVDGKNDNELMKEAAKQIQQLAYAKYQELYS